jgi:hypothetical protein
MASCEDTRRRALRPMLSSAHAAAHSRRDQPGLDEHHAGGELAPEQRFRRQDLRADNPNTLVAATVFVAVTVGLSRERCFRPDALTGVGEEGAPMTTLDAVPKKKPEPSAEELRRSPR